MPLIIAAYPVLAAGVKAVGARVAAGAAARGIASAARFARTPAGQKIIKEGVKNLLGPRNVARVQRGVKKASQAIGTLSRKYGDEIEAIKDVLEELADNWDQTMEFLDSISKTSISSLQRSFQATKKMPGLTSYVPVYYTPSSSSSTNNARPNRVKAKRTG